MSSLASSYPHRVAGGAVVGGGGGGGGYGGVSGNAFHNESLSRYGGHDALMASRYGNEHGLFAGGGGVGVGGGGYGVSDAGSGLGSSYFGGIPSYTTPPSSHPQYHQMLDQNQARWGNTAVNGLLPGQNPNISHLEASLGGGGGIKRSLDDVYLSVDGLYKRTRMETGNNLPVYPQRPGEKDCAFYMKTRNCKFGGNCKFDHPAWVPAGGIPDWKEAAPPKTLSLPVRTGEPDCVFYMKYGSCKFGENCKFNHPQDRSAGSEGATSEQNGMDEDKVTEAEKEKNTTLKPASQFNAKGLPVRPGETDCPFYMKKGSCKYGSTCRFNHPDKPASVSVPVQQMSMDTLAALSGGGLVGLPGFGGLTGGLPGGVFGGLSGLAGGLGHHQYIGASPDFGLAGLGMGPVGNLTINPAPYPQRPGEQECSYYMKTGICKYGVGCKFNHPINRTEASQPESKLTLAGLPRREGETTCAFYLKTGACKYGANCRFDHPPPGEVVAKALADAKKTDEDEDEEAGEEDQSS